jgi:threonine/homoserine/homoserine lactone efflux protein
LLDGSFNYNAQIVALVIMLAILNISTHFIWVTAGNHISRWTDNKRFESKGLVVRIRLFFVASYKLVS